MSKMTDVSKKMLSISRGPKYGTSEGDGVSLKRFVEISGKKYMLKGDALRESIVEVFAYRFGKKLGLNVLPVYYVENKTKLFPKAVSIISVHKWEETFETIAEIYDGEIDDEDIYDSFEEKGLQMLIFDVLINNGDRHQSNYGMLKGSEELQLIDHGLAKPEKMVELGVNTTRGLNLTINEMVRHDRYRELTLSFLEKVAEVTSEDINKMLLDLSKYNKPICRDIAFNILRTINNIKRLLKIEKGGK